MRHIRYLEVCTSTPVANNTARVPATQNEEKHTRAETHACIPVAWRVEVEVSPLAAGPNEVELRQGPNLVQTKTRRKKNVRKERGERDPR